MGNGTEHQRLTDKRMLKTIEETEEEKAQKLVNLIVRVIVKATLKEYYEKSN